MGLAEGDAPVQHLGRPRDDEQRLAILLELGPLVGLERVLDGEVMQAELRLEPPQEVEAGLVQADPDHVPGLARPLADVLDRNLGHPSASRIGGRGDHAGSVLGLNRNELESVCHDQSTHGSPVRCQGRGATCPWDDVSAALLGTILGSLSQVLPGRSDYGTGCPTTAG